MVDKTWHLRRTLSEFLTANTPNIGQSIAPIYDENEYVDNLLRAKWVVIVFLSAVEYEVISSSELFTIHYYIVIVLYYAPVLYNILLFCPVL